jgi:pseudaminic acid cytidylyltransferase
MIAWTIETAHASGLFDHILVSTDAADIGAIAVQWGAECPFVRPAHLADDRTGTTEVIAHATQWALDARWPLDAVCCMYPTAPFIEVEDLKRGLAALVSGDWAFAIAVTDFAAPIFRSFKQREDGGIEMFFPEHFTTRSQDLPRAFHDAGQFYWGRPTAWVEGQQVFDRRSVPILIPRWRVQDIDGPDDWVRAEMLFAQLRGRPCE